MHCVSCMLTSNMHCWIIGNSYSLESLNHRSIGPSVKKKLTDPRCIGPAVYQTLGLKNPRSIETFSIIGLSDPRSNGRTLGLTAGPSVDRTFGLSDPRTCGLSDPRSKGLAVYRTLFNNRSKWPSVYQAVTMPVILWHTYCHRLYWRPLSLLVPSTLDL